MEGKVDPFFRRVSFVGQVSGALSVPKSKCLVLLRDSSEQILLWERLEGPGERENPKAKIKSPSAFAALDFSSSGVLPVPLAVERGVRGVKGGPTRKPRHHLGLH